ncbi:MAG: argininosuccinate lyase [Acidobacteriota bacterium]
MKRVALALLVAVVLAGSAAVFAGDQNFTLINKTGLTIDKVYVSPANDNSWGEDVLGRDTLANGEKVDIKFSRKEDECVWDLKIVDEEKDDVVWEDINLCKAEEITLLYQNKRPTAIIK